MSFFWIGCYVCQWIDELFLLKQLEHPHLSELKRENFIWSLSNVALLEDYMYALDGDPHQKVVQAVLKEFKTSVLPNHHAFRKCTSFNIIATEVK